MENHGADSEFTATLRNSISAFMQSMLPPLQPIEEFGASFLIIDAANRSLAVIQIPTADGSDKPGPLPASKASIDALPRITVTDQDCVVKECAICLEEIDIAGSGGAETREMPCKHGFHSSCIEKWLKIHGSCPVCRFLMPVEEDGGSENGRRQRSSIDGDGDGGENGRRQRRRLISVGLVILNSDESLPPSFD